MRTPATKGGRLGQRAWPAQSEDDTRNTSPSDPRRVTTLPVLSLTLALDHLDHLGLCACWTAPRRRHWRARR